MEQELTTNERFARICMNAKNVMDYVDKNGYISNDKSNMAKMLESGTYKPRLANKFSEESINKSKLPKEIIESMVSNPIDVDNGFEKNLNEILTSKPSEKRAITENTETPIAQTNSSIDYSIIRMIVEDAVKKYSNSLKKTLLKESTSNENEIKAMKMGKKLQFITENGDLYEAEFKFVKNLKKK